VSLFDPPHIQRARYPMAPAGGQGTDRVKKRTAWCPVRRSVQKTGVDRVVRCPVIHFELKQNTMGTHGVN
jgi:hypothetical protein